ncbi:MAG: HVO_2922 family protein [Halobacteriota archaeon]
MAQSTAKGPLTSIYENRIGTPTNANEVMGYWAFLAGVVLGLIALVVYFLTEPTTMMRGFGYSMAALAPALIMTGAVLRFPLRRAATSLTALGLLVTFVAVAWFMSVFPSGWSTTTGHLGVILTYTSGLAVIGIAGGFVPLVTDTRLADAEQAADEARAEAAAAEEEAESEHEKAAASARENERKAAEREEALQAEIVGLEGENAGLKGDDTDLRSSKADFEMYRDNDGQWRWRLTHDNGNIIADCGEGYSSKANARKGLESVKLNALGAEIGEV